MIAAELILGGNVGLPWGILLATMNLWYALPLVVSVSLVCAATRHELMGPILQHAARFAAWVLAFMGLFMVVLWLMQYMT